MSDKKDRINKVHQPFVNVWCELWVRANNKFNDINGIIEEIKKQKISILGHKIKLFKPQAKIRESTADTILSFFDKKSLTLENLAMAASVFELLDPKILAKLKSRKFSIKLLNESDYKQDKTVKFLEGFVGRNTPGFIWGNKLYFNKDVFKNIGVDYKTSIMQKHFLHEVLHSIDSLCLTSDQAEKYIEPYNIDKLAYGNFPKILSEKALQKFNGSLYAFQNCTEYFAELGSAIIDPSLPYAKKSFSDFYKSLDKLGIFNIKTSDAKNLSEYLQIPYYLYSILTHISAYSEYIKNPKVTQEQKEKCIKYIKGLEKLFDDYVKKVEYKGAFLEILEKCKKEGLKIPLR